MPRLLNIAFFLITLTLLVRKEAYGQIQQITKELDGLSKVSDSVSKMNVFIRLGDLYRTRQIDSVFYYGMEAKRLATQLGNETGQIHADHLIAFSFFKRGLYAEALELLGQVLFHHQYKRDTVNIIRTYIDIASVRNQGIAEQEEQIALLQKAIHLGQQLQNDSILATTYQHYVLRNTTLSKDSIRQYLDRSREIANRFGNKHVLTTCDFWEARLLVIDNELEKALPLVEKVLQSAQDMGNANLEINALFLMVGFTENKPLLHLQYMYQALEVADKSGDKSLEIYILNNILDTANDMGDKEEIIKAYAGLTTSMSAEWERSKKFINDYVKFNDLQETNKILYRKNIQRTTWLIIISFSGVILLLLIYLIMLQRQRKAKKLIETLNQVANMQVFAMEEIKQQVILEEQKRLGQDLHDGLSSSIAAIRHQLEILVMDTSDIDLKGRLESLLKASGEAYEIARNKSHELFRKAEISTEQSFEKQIKLMTENALPAQRYQKTIHIDDHALQYIHADFRISLLRIIQEAITNIIKHAKAKSVEILMYQEEKKLVLSIQDDGKGFSDKVGLIKVSAPSTWNTNLGLQSIHKRVQYMNGRLEILSGQQGTEILITIPIQKNMPRN